MLMRLCGNRGRIKKRKKRLVVADETLRVNRNGGKYAMKDYLQEFWEEESGIGVVEIILILVILIMLVVIFRTQITAIVTSAFEEINSGASTVNSKISIGKEK